MPVRACTTTWLPEAARSYVDYNLRRVPLIEIVSEPDMRSADEAVRVFEKASPNSSLHRGM